MLSTVLWLNVVTNVNVKVLQLITLNAFIGSMNRGLGFGVLCAPAQLVCVTPLYVFLFALHVEYNVRTYRPVHVFDNISFGQLLDKFTSC